MSSLRLFVLTPYFAASESAAPAKARCADLGFVSQFRPYRDFKGGGAQMGLMFSLFLAYFGRNGPATPSRSAASFSPL